MLVVASGSGAAMPHKAIVERGYKGKIYQTHAAATPRPGAHRRQGRRRRVRRLRPGGGRRAAARQPPVEGGRGRLRHQVREGLRRRASRNQFAGHAYDAPIVLEKVLPVALKKAKPGTPEFRAALRDASRRMGRTIFSHGVMNWTADRPLGLHQRDRRDAEGRRRQVRRREVTPATLRRRPSAQPGCGPTAWPRQLRRMDFSIAGILALDGLTNGAIYALLALATVLVFAVTRVIFIPQGEFVAFGALTLALLQTGKVPGTVWFLLVLAAARRPCRRLVTACARRPAARRAWRSACCARWPSRWRSSLLAIWAAPQRLPLLAQAALTLALVTPFGAADLPPGLRVAGRCQRAGAADRLGRRALRAGRAGPVLLRRRGLPQPELLGRALHASAPLTLIGPDADHLRRLARADRRRCGCSSSARCTARRCAPPR